MDDLEGRQRAIVDAMLQDREVSQSQLARTFGVSRTTIRADLDKLQAAGVLASDNGNGWEVVS